jgi:hypothetical protein
VDTALVTNKSSLKLSLTVKSVISMSNTNNHWTLLKLSFQKLVANLIFARGQRTEGGCQYVLVRFRMFDNPVARTNVVSSNFEFPDSPKSRGVLGAKSL